MGDRSLRFVLKTSGLVMEVAVVVEVVVMGRERECCWSGLEGWSWSGVRASCCGPFIHATAPEVEDWVR